MAQKKTYEELDAEAKVILSLISGLEQTWESESEPEKLAKLESKIDRLETRKDKLYERIDRITNEEEDGLSTAPPDIDKQEEEEEEEMVCKDCGGDLKEIEDGAYECTNCGEIWENDGK